ncbi:MAG: hypothetical protein MAG795_00580 [Candidatus Woesearchaeota archaeon]|nr:hypothetical protein [Candidatus Woesearchaeota archaeon]
MFIIDKGKKGVFSLPAKEIDPADAYMLKSKLALKILKLLVKKSMYPVEIANELGVHEQKVYYHIRNFEKSGLVKIVKKETKQGAIAKYYKVTHPSFVIKLKELEPTQKIATLKSGSKFLEPFIKNGQLDARVIVGSPDPHGPDKARSRDGYYGIDLGLFLGTFLNYVPDFNVMLDTEVRQKDLRGNLILIGGPIVNKVTEKVNTNLPVRFSKKNNWAIESQITKKLYHSDEIGIVVSAKNPLSKDHYILLVAGKRFSGTRAGIIAILKYFKEITKGNLHNNKIKAKIVEGVDLDSDGIIDDIEFLE